MFKFCLPNQVYIDVNKAARNRNISNYIIY